MRLSSLWRIAVLLLWLGLLAALLGRDFLVEEIRSLEIAALERGRETSFAGVYFQNERIGFVRSRLTPASDGQMGLEQEAYLRLNILGETHPLRLRLSATLSPASELSDFQLSLISPFSATEAQGRVEGNDILLTLQTPRGPRRERIKLQAPPRLATPHRAYLLAHDPEVGSRLRVSYFDPVSLADSERVLEYRGRDRVLIAQRLHNLHHFHETVAGMRINLWLDDQGRVIKEESATGFVFLAEPEFRATDIPGAGPEILTAVAVPLSGELPADLARRPSLTYRLIISEDADPELLNTLELDGGGQHWQGELLTIHRQQLPPPTATACNPTLEGERDPVGAALAATTHLQSDAPELVELARQISSRAKSDFARLQALATWVYQNIEKRPVLGIPNALEVLASRMGDCNEHATLFAALARAVGLPTRIAAGLLYQDGIFFYHAWNEVCLNGEWLGVDTTTNKLPVGLTHLRLLNGETRELIRLGALLGRLRLEVSGEPEREQGAEKP